MQTLIYAGIIMIGTLLCSCATTTKDKIVGKWKFIDKHSICIIKINPDQTEQITIQLKDHRYICEISGTWKLDKNVIITKMIQARENGKTIKVNKKIRARIIEINDNKLTLSILNGNEKKNIKETWKRMK